MTNGKVDLLKTLASVDKAGNVYLIVLNRSFDTNINAEIKIPCCSMVGF